MKLTHRQEVKRLIEVWGGTACAAGLAWLGRQKSLEEAAQNIPHPNYVLFTFSEFYDEFYDLKIAARNPNIVKLNRACRDLLIKFPETFDCIETVTNRIHNGYLDGDEFYWDLPQATSSWKLRKYAELLVEGVGSKTIVNMWRSILNR